MRLLLVVAALAALACAGCATGFGPTAIRTERPGFNEELIRSDNEQLLVNLVRLRYLDAPMFLELSSVVAQYGLEAHGNVSGSVNFSGTANTLNGTGVNAGADATYSEHPTVSYAPLQGDEFAKRMLSPIPLETVVLLSRSGWSGQRLMDICVERMNGLENAASASGPPPAEAPTYEQFQQTTALFKRLSKIGALVTVASAEASHKIAWRVDYQRAIAANADQDLATFLKNVGLPPDTKLIVPGTPYEKNADTSLVLAMRSMMGVLFFLSNSVQAPPEHYAQGLVERTHLHGSDVPFDWSQVTKNVMTIKTSPKRPEHAYVATRYRENWFYIDDADRNSKATFALLHYLLSLQSTSGSGKMPLLTLPAGG